MSPVASTGHPFSVASVSTQAGSACLASWHDHAYQQIQLLRDMYLSDVVKLYKRANELCLQLTNAETATKYQKTRIFVEKIYKFLQISRTDMIQMPEDKVCSYMNTVTSYLDSVRSKNSALVQQQQQEQLLMLPGSQSKTLMPPHRSMNFQFTSLPQGLTFSHVDSSHLTPPQGFTRLLAASTINSLQSGPLPGRETRNALRQLQGSSSSSKYSINRPEWIRNSKTGQEQRNASPLCHHSAKSAQRSTLTVPEQSTLLVPEQTNSSPRTNLNSSDSTTSSVSSSSTSFPSQRHMLQVEKLKLPMQQPLIEPNRQQIQHHSTGQHTEYSPRSLLPSNLYQLHASSQTSQLSSPQVDMRNLLPPPSKTGTPLHSTSSPFLLSCPSTPLTPSSVPVDSEKLLLQKIPTFIAENPQHQERPVMSVDFQSRLTTENQTTVIDTHVTSTSPLPVGVTSSEGSQQLDSLGRAHKRLVEAVRTPPFTLKQSIVKALSTEALSSALHDMSAVICMTDRTAETSLSASRGAIGLDLVDEFNCNCQESLLQLGSPSAEIMRRHMNSMPSDASISPLGENENFQILSTWATYSQSAAALTIKRPRIESSRVLLEEINEINQKLVETILDVVSDPFKDADRIGAAQGTIVRCSYRAVAFGETFKQQFASSGMNLLLRLLVPMDYPDSSPVILDEFSGGWSENSEDLTEKVKMNFSLSLRKLSQPMLLEEIARTWDTCARAVLTEVAEQRGGVAFTSRYGTWETCIITPCSS
ncbi:hypothetical protein RJ640_025094 [Escallonia rubra]|uniref:ARC105/Med15 mediator subunit C-terminal domain-containing protein n=1 Tax=Escallonia rubra TaxID=112253 RepID=A0AA88REX7_9ASTE|nr:hypothetical protein RJ640_025094 [Escallonia rubra]